MKYYNMENFQIIYRPQFICFSLFRKQIKTKDILFIGKYFYYKVKFLENWNRLKDFEQRQAFS